MTGWIFTFGITSSLLKTVMSIMIIVGFFSNSFLSDNLLSSKKKKKKKSYEHFFQITLLSLSPSRTGKLNMATLQLSYYIHTLVKSYEVSIWKQGNDSDITTPIHIHWLNHMKLLLGNRMMIV